MRYSHGLLKDVPARVPLPNKNIQRGPYWGFLILITVAQTLAKFFGEKKSVCWCPLWMPPETPDWKHTSSSPPPAVHPRWLMPPPKMFSELGSGSAQPSPGCSPGLSLPLGSCLTALLIQDQNSPNPVKCLFIFLPFSHQSSNLACSRGSGKALHQWWGWQEGLGSGI